MATMNQDVTIILQDNDFLAEISPETGGLVRRLNWRDMPLLFPALGAQDADSTANRYGLWPLVPFANRAFGARLLTPSGHRGLPVNDPADGSAMHGFGWQAAWRVTEQDPSGIALSHAYGLADPYRYAATLRLDLAPGLARFTISVRNEAAEPMPFGLGLHPWFPRDAATRLRFNARRKLRFGPRYRAQGIEEFTGTGYDAGRLLPDAEAISAIGWAGPAELTLPGGVTLAIDASETLRHPVLWTPAGAPFVCFEPQSHAIGAPSEPLVAGATPLTMLAPGEELSGWMTLAPKAC